jgi:hypothetical protein
MQIWIRTRFRFRLKRNIILVVALVAGAYAFWPLGRQGPRLWRASSADTAQVGACAVALKTAWGAMLDTLCPSRDAEGRRVCQPPSEDAGEDDPDFAALATLLDARPLDWVSARLFKTPAMLTLTRPACTWLDWPGDPDASRILRGAVRAAQGGVTLDWHDGPATGLACGKPSGPAASRRGADGGPCRWRKVRGRRW